jgi:hypothetical protein
MKRFPRAHLRKAGGLLQTADVVSIFHEEVLKADIKAFSALKHHVKEVDEAHSTVIMVQVENEIGLLGDSRDGSPTANKRFSEPVPIPQIQHLSTKWDTLHADLKRNLRVFKALGKSSGSWEAVFGRSQQTDELFMAYHYAIYVEKIAVAGKKEYALPLYTNVWQNYVGDDGDNAFPTVAGGGGAPGDYPSDGGVSNVLDIWRTFAPSLDFIAPDIYLNDYSSSCAKYRHLDQPLFIPEQRRDEYGARRIWKAFGSTKRLAPPHSASIPWNQRRIHLPGTMDCYLVSRASCSKLNETRVLQQDFSSTNSSPTDVTPHHPPSPSSATSKSPSSDPSFSVNPTQVQEC